MRWNWITIVSGLPRSGTSLMMQMLAAGGMPVLTDQIRAPDEDNPRGYLEFERVKQIKQDNSWLADAQGKAVKMVHLLLTDLPRQYDYRVIFMRRRLDEVLASQRKMLARGGKQGAGVPESTLARTFEQQVAKVMQWLGQQPNVKTQEVWYHDVIASPAAIVHSVNSFLDGTMDESAMGAAIDPALYRNRSA
jgi:hypothetical protein